MKVIVMNIDSFDSVQLNGVSNIAYDDATKVYTVTHSGGTSSFSALTTNINILW